MLEFEVCFHRNHSIKLELEQLLNAIKLALLSPPRMIQATQKEYWWFHLIPVEVLWILCIILELEAAMILLSLHLSFSTVLWLEAKALCLLGTDFTTNPNLHHLFSSFFPLPVLPLFLIVTQCGQCKNYNKFITNKQHVFILSYHVKRQ